MDRVHKVSVIMPTYNGASRGFLKEAIDSVLSQTYSYLELLVIDDGSSDGTRDLCASYGDRIRYLHQNNSGVAAARNKGIECSDGDLLCFLDDDDLWMPNKLERQVEFVKKCDNWGLCYTGLEIIDDKGRTGFVQMNHASGNVFLEMLSENLVNCTSSVIIPRWVLDEVGGFKEHLRYAEDYDLWLRIAKRFAVYSLDEVLVLYRQHGSNVSTNLDKIDFFAEQVVFEWIKSSPSGMDSCVVLNKFYKKRAAYRFWLEDYKTFRKYVHKASCYGGLGAGFRTRVWLSYFPRTIRFVRGVKRRVIGRSVFCRWI